MPPKSEIDKALVGAKSTLAASERRFPSAMARGAGAGRPTAPIRTAPVTSSAAAGGRALTRQQNVQAVGDVMKSAGMTGAGTIGAMHEGGKVPKTGPYRLEKGEVVIPADKTKGRGSEYRKVFVARRQTRQGGGNTPVKGEKHDSKKA